MHNRKSRTYPLAICAMLSAIILLLNLLNVQLFLTCTVVCYVVFAVMYLLIYLLTARTYYKIVSK